MTAIQQRHAGYGSARHGRSDGSMLEQGLGALQRRPARSPPTRMRCSVPPRQADLHRQAAAAEFAHERSRQHPHEKNASRLAGLHLLAPDAARRPHERPCQRVLPGGNDAQASADGLRATRATTAACSRNWPPSVAAGRQTDPGGHRSRPGGLRCADAQMIAAAPTAADGEGCRQSGVAAFRRRAGQGQTSRHAGQDLHRAVYSWAFPNVAIGVLARWRRCFCGCSSAST